MTEFTSNVSTTTIVLPILAALAQDLEINPLLLIIPGGYTYMLLI